MRLEFGTAESVEVPAIPAATPKKRSLLPVLVVLFLVSYGIMTALIVEQGQTIESQRALIRELFRDSTELSAVKMKAQEERSRATRSQAPNAQAPTNQTPSPQAQTKQAPSTQVVPQSRAQNQKPKSQFDVPSKPAADLTDSRRSLITI